MIEAINDEEAIMIVIDRKAPWMLELAWLVAFLAELGHERAIIAREYLHSIVHTIDYRQEISMIVEHEVARVVELAIIWATLLGADRELDSSITIKRIVFHLFHFNLSLNDKEMFQAPNCSNQRDEDEALSLTRHETRERERERERERHQASKQRATRSNR